VSVIFQSFSSRRPSARGGARARGVWIPPRVHRFIKFHLTAKSGTCAGSRSVLIGLTSFDVKCATGHRYGAQFPPARAHLFPAAGLLTIQWAEFFGSPNFFESPPIVNWVHLAAAEPNTSQTMGSRRGSKDSSLSRPRHRSCILSASRNCRGPVPRRRRTGSPHGLLG